MTATGAEPEAIPVFDLGFEEEDIDAVAATLRSGWLTMGPRTEEFEQRFAAHLGSPYAVALSSGTAALHLAYLAAGVGPGDEVIVPGNTFVASAAAARYCGATAVLADVDGPARPTVDPADIAARVGPRTVAVCAVHYGGYAAPLEALGRLCEDSGLALIEDAAHSPDASEPGGGPKLGTIGTAGCFSFFSNKILSCGEGGLLATADAAIAERARRLRSHAMTSGTWERHRGHARGYDVLEVGFNYRLDEVRAALLVSRLPRLREDVAERRRLTRLYRELLADAEGIELPFADADVETSSCYLMAVMLDPHLRDRVRELLTQRHGIQTTVLYPALNQFAAYGGGTQELPGCEAIAAGQLTLPLFPHLGDERVERVALALRECVALARSPQSRGRAERRRSV